MKKQKSDEPTDRQRITVLSLLAVIMTIFFIFTALQLDSVRHENIQLKNEKADAFCKGQSYEVVIKPEKMGTKCINNTKTYNNIRINGDNMSAANNDIFTNVTAYNYYICVNNCPENNSFNGCEINNICKRTFPALIMSGGKLIYTPQNSNLLIDFTVNNEVCNNIITVSAMTETRSFETGYYNQIDNFYYCQAETKTHLNDCYDRGKKCIDNFDKSNGNFSITCKDISICYTNKIVYQKVQKFPYPDANRNTGSEFIKNMRNMFGGTGV